MSAAGLSSGGVSASGISYSAEATALFARFSTPPSTARKALIDTYIAALKTASLWTNIAALQVYAANDAQASLLNWKADQYNATVGVQPTFTQDRGYTGNSTSQYLDVGVAPNGVSGWAENTGTIAAWNLSTGVANNGYLLGLVGSSLVNIAQRNNTDGVVSAKINSSTTSTVTSATITGLYSATRRGAAETEIYINGASAGTTDPSAGTAAPASANFSTHRSNNSYSNRQVGLVCIAGAAWSDADHAAFYNASLAYMQGVGAA